jgi:hypothetical protein
MIRRPQKRLLVGIEVAADRPERSACGSSDRAIAHSQLSDRANRSIRLPIAREIVLPLVNFARENLFEREYV